MIKNYLTCERYLENYNKGDKTVVARLDNPEHIHVRETDDTYMFYNGSHITVPRYTHDYLVGPIAETLHAYEELGYSPEELKKIVEEHAKWKKALTSVKIPVNAIYGTTAFANSSNRFIEEMREAHRRLEELKYIDTDIAVTQMIYDRTPSLKKAMDAVLIGDWVKNNSIKPDPKPNPSKPETKSNSAPVVDKAIFNNPATIVFWSDGTKTVVKCSENDIYDPEKGLAMAFAKKMFGNDNTFHKHFKKWLPKEEASTVDIKVDSFAERLKASIADGINNIFGHGNTGGET